MMIRAFKLGGTEFEILCFEFVMYDFDQLNKYLINLCFFHEMIKITVMTVDIFFTIEGGFAGVCCCFIRSESGNEVNMIYVPPY